MTRHRCWKSFAAGLLLVACSACGMAEYNARLEETRKYFTYLERMDTNLAARGFREPPIEQLRVPAQFSLIPKPKMEKNPDGSLKKPEFDPRQPDFMNTEFPGLVATWKTPLEVTIEGKPDKRPGYIFALSNLALLQTNQSELASFFLRDVRRLMAATFQSPLVDSESMGERVQFPRSTSYTTPVSYFMTRFNSEMPINDIRYDVELYGHQSGSIQVALLIVTPRDAEQQRSRLNERISLMLETLLLAKSVSQARSSGAGGPARAPQPAGGGVAAPTGF